MISCQSSLLKSEHRRPTQGGSTGPAIPAHSCRPRSISLPPGRLRGCKRAGRSSSRARIRPRSPPKTAAARTAASCGETSRGASGRPASRHFAALVGVFRTHGEGSKRRNSGAMSYRARVRPVELDQSLAIEVDRRHAARHAGKSRQLRPAGVNRHPLALALPLQTLNFHRCHDRR